MEALHGKAERCRMGVATTAVFDLQSQGNLFGALFLF